MSLTEKNIIFTSKKLRVLKTYPVHVPIFPIVNLPALFPHGEKEMMVIKRSSSNLRNYKDTCNCMQKIIWIWEKLAFFAAV